jgi:hypothetical protein
VPSRDLDARAIICRCCGETFVGGDGWQPVCWYCWTREREQREAWEEQLLNPDAPR